MSLQTVSVGKSEWTDSVSFPHHPPFIILLYFQVEMMFLPMVSVSNRMARKKKKYLVPFPHHIPFILLYFLQTISVGKRLARERRGSMPPPINCRTVTATNHILILVIELQLFCCTWVGQPSAKFNGVAPQKEWRWNTSALLTLSTLKNIPRKRCGNIQISSLLTS